MSYIQIYATAHDTEFQNRCRVAMWRAAQDISAEPEDTENHSARREWATRVMQDAVTIRPHVLAMQVLRNPVIAADPAGAADDAIQFQVNSVLNSIIAIG